MRAPGRIASAVGRLCLAAGTGLLLILGLTNIGTLSPGGHHRPAPDRSAADSRPDLQAAGYRAGGTLGFTLRETVITEQTAQRVEGDERGLLWTARFMSRWPLTEDQLDRWSAQVIGRLADRLGTDVRLAGWARLEALGLGEQQVAYHYQLTAASTEQTGEASVVVFARGEQVGLAGAAALGSPSPVDAMRLAHGLDSQSSGREATSKQLKEFRNTQGERAGPVSMQGTKKVDDGSGPGSTRPGALSPLPWPAVP